MTRISQFVNRFKNERIRQGVIAKMPGWRIIVCGFADVFLITYLIMCLTLDVLF